MKKKQIIIAEDEPAYRNLLKTKLIDEGYDVITVINGEELMTNLKKNTPQLILLDLIMPLKNGFQVLEELKKIKDLKKVPVMAITNLGQDEEINKAKSLGIDDYLIKSDESFYDVIRKIKKLLSKL